MRSPEPPSRRPVIERIRWARCPVHVHQPAVSGLADIENWKSRAKCSQPDM